MSTIIETLEDGTRRAVTIVAKNGVYYSVEKMVDGEWVATWEKRVNFGRLAYYRPAGMAFKAAAREQEQRLTLK